MEYSKNDLRIIKKYGSGYIGRILEKYKEIYTQFTEEQIERSIITIISRIDCHIMCFNDFFEKLHRIYYMKTLYCRSESPSVGMRMIFDLSKGGHDSVKHCFGPESSLVLDRDGNDITEDYLKFISKITNSIIIELCSYLEATVPKQERDNFRGLVEKYIGSEYFKDNALYINNEESSAASVESKGNESGNDSSNPNKKARVEDENGSSSSSKSRSSNDNSANDSSEFQSGDEDKKTTNNVETDNSKNASVNSLILEDILSWIYELPEFLQSKFLQLESTIATILSVEAVGKIVDKKNINYVLYYINPQNIKLPEENMEGKAAVYYDSHHDPFNKTIVMGELLSGLEGDVTNQ